MNTEAKVIPEKLNAELKVNIQIPPEATRLMDDLHNDRQGIGIGGCVLVGCVVALTLRRVLGKS